MRENSEETRSIKLDCKVCQASITCEVPVKPRSDYPFPFVFYHGHPLHALILYIDANYKIRGMEIAREMAGTELTPAAELDLLQDKLEVAINEKREIAVRVLSRRISEMLVTMKNL